MERTGKEVYGFGEGMNRLQKRECSIWLLLSIMIFSQNVYVFNGYATGMWAAMRDIIQITILLYLVIVSFKRNVFERGLLCAYFGLMLTFAVSMLFNLDFFSNEYWILECTISFLVINLYDYRKLLVKFERIMFFICSFYTFCYFIARLFLDVLQNPIYLFLERCHIFYPHSQNLNFYISGAAVMRSCAFYREPGIYQMFIILALEVELLSKRPKRIWHILIYCISLLATYSTTGYICLFIVLLGWGFISFCSTRCIRKSILVGIMCGMIGVLRIMPQLAQIVVSKFLATGESGHSWLSRKASVLTNLFFWGENSVTGVGIHRIMSDFTDVTKDIFHIKAGSYLINDNTNTVLLFFAAFGTLAGVLFLIGQWRGICKMTRNAGMLLTIFFVLIFLYAGEAVNSTCLPYMIYFIGFSGVREFNTVWKGVGIETEYRSSKT